MRRKGVKQMKVKAFLLGGAIIVGAVGGGYAYVSHTKVAEAEQSAQYYEDARKAIDDLYVNTKQKEPKVGLKENWDKKISSLIEKVEDQDKKSELYTELSNVSKMDKARNSIENFVENGVVKTPKINGEHEIKINTVHDNQLKNAKTHLEGIKNINKTFYTRLKKDFDEGNKQVSFIKKVYNKLNGKKESLSIKEFEQLENQIKEIKNKDDQKTLLKLAKDSKNKLVKKEEVKKNIETNDTKVNSKEDDRKTEVNSENIKTSSSAVERNRNSNNSSKQTEQNNNYSSPSNSSSGSSYSHKNSGSSSNSYSNSSPNNNYSSNHNYNNSKSHRSSSNGGYSSNKSSNNNTSNKTSNGSKKNSSNNSNKNNNSHMDDVNSIVDSINKGNSHKKGSGEIDKGGNSWEEYDINP